MKIIIVHGKHPSKPGEIHHDLKLRLEKALELDRAEKFDAILLSGGVTRRWAIAEALQSENYLKDKTNTPLMVESRPHSTSEEIRFIKERLRNETLDKVVVIVSEPYLKRTEYLYSVLWPELKSITFAPSKSGVSVFAPIREVLYRAYARFDPYEKFLPAKIFKKFFRE